MNKKKQVDTIAYTNLSDIEVKEISKKYEISDGKCIVKAIVFYDGKISLINECDDGEFIFHHSKPEIIESIANLMLAIVKLKK